MSNRVSDQQAVLAAVKQEIAKSLRKGKKKDEIIQPLIARGLSREKAAVLVDQVEAEISLELDDLDRHRQEARAGAIRMMTRGGGGTVIGIILTFVGYTLARQGLCGGYYLIFSGAVLFGLLWFVFGVVALIRSYTM